MKFEDYVSLRESVGQTFILWGNDSNKLKYKGKVGGPMWDGFIINAKQGHGLCYLIDAIDVQDAKQKIELAQQSSIPNVFIFGDNAKSVITKFR